MSRKGAYCGNCDEVFPDLVGDHYADPVKKYTLECACGTVYIYMPICGWFSALYEIPPNERGTRRLWRDRELIEESSE